MTHSEPGRPDHLGEIVVAVECESLLVVQQEVRGGGTHLQPWFLQAEAVRGFRAEPGQTGLSGNLPAQTEAHSLTLGVGLGSLVQVEDHPGVFHDIKEAGRLSDIKFFTFL